MSRILSAVLAASFLAFSPCLAADLPRRGAPADYYAPPPITPPWQGFYAGINGGYAFSSFNDDAVRNVLGSPNGGFIGVTGGYNYMAAPNLLVGLEGDFAFADSKSYRTPLWGFSSSGRVDDMLTVRARVGYAIDRGLVFATGGLAGSRNTATLSSFLPPLYAQQSIYQIGWAIGGGFEYMLTNNLSAKAEYLYSGVGSDRYFEFSPAPFTADVSTSTIKTGLNYHF